IPQLSAVKCAPCWIACPLQRGEDRRGGEERQVGTRRWGGRGRRGAAGRAVERLQRAARLGQYADEAPHASLGEGQATILVDEVPHRLRPPTSAPDDLRVELLLRAQASRRHLVGVVDVGIYQPGEATQGEVVELLAARGVDDVD